MPIQFGSFIAAASVNTNAQFDSNLFAAANNIQSDGVFLVQPRVSLQSNWTRNALSFDLGSVTKQTLAHPTEDTTSYRANANGRVDIGARTNVTTSVGFVRAFVSRGALQDASNVGAPIGFNQVLASASVISTFANTQLRASATYSDFNHLTKGGISPRDALDRNFKSLDVTGAVGYSVSPGIAVVATAMYNRSLYPDSIVNRDSTGYRLLGGVAFGASRLIRGVANVGYQRQNYENPLFPKVSGLDFDASLTWTPYRTLTLSTRIDRSIQRSAIASVAGIVDTIYSVEADYEYRRNVILSAGIDYERADYNDSPLKFRNVEGRVAAQWLISRRVSVNFAFNQSFTRSTDRLAQRFARTQASAGVKLSL